MLFHEAPIACQPIQITPPELSEGPFRDETLRSSPEDLTSIHTLHHMDVSYPLLLSK